MAFPTVKAGSDTTLSRPENPGPWLEIHKLAKWQNSWNQSDYKTIHRIHRIIYYIDKISLDLTT